jgi:hypothetical protein
LTGSAASSGARTASAAIGTLDYKRNAALRAPQTPTNRN